MSQDLPPELESRPQSRREWHGYLRSLVLPLALVVALVAGLFYLQNRSSGQSSDGAFGTVALPADLNVTGKDPSADAGRAAPDFELPALDGSISRLSDLQGHPILVNFWASWCGPCRQEMPSIVEAYLQNQPAGLRVLAVNVREADERARAFSDEFTLPFTVLLDRSGEVSRTWRIGGPTGGLPSSYFVDSRGVVQKVVYGSLTAKSLAEGLGLILNPGN